MLLVPDDPAEEDMQQVLSQLPHEGVNLLLKDFDMLLAHPILYSDCDHITWSQTHKRMHKRKNAQTLKQTSKRAQAR